MIITQGYTNTHRSAVVILLKFSSSSVQEGLHIVTIEDHRTRPINYAKICIGLYYDSPLWPLSHRPILNFQI